MKANQLATLALRLMGIYCLVHVIPFIAMTVTAVSFAQAPAVDGKEHFISNLIVLAAAVLPFLCFLAMGILLITRSVPWGEKLTPKEAGDGNITAVSFEQVQVLAFAVAGVLIFAEALPQLLNSISSIFISLNGVTGRSPYPASTRYSGRALLTAVGNLLKAALGLWLFFGARGFANFWRSLRPFATPKPPPEN